MVENHVAPNTNGMLSRLSVPLFLFALFLVLIPVAYFASRNYASWPGIIIFWPLGMTVAAGILIAGREATRDAKQATNAVARTGEKMPRDGATAVIVGTLEVFGESLRSPFSGTESIYYYYTAGHLEERRRSANSTDIESGMVHVTHFEGYGVVPAHIHSAIGNFKLLRIPTHFDAFVKFESTSTAMGDAWLRFLNETKFVQETRHFGMLGVIAARIAKARPAKAAVREDACYDSKPQPLQVFENAIPAGLRVIAKGKYSAAEGGLTGTISLTVVTDEALKRLNKTTSNYIIGAVAVILITTGLASLLAIFG